MSPHRMHTALHAFIIAVALMTGAPLASAATWNLSNVPLAAATSVVPNVFFELDDSGSMDWEIMTPSYWTWRAYDPDETLIGGSFTSSNGGAYNADGLWDSYYSTSSSSSGGSWGGGGGGWGGSTTTYTSATYDYIFNSSDNLYGTGCDSAVIACGALGTTTNYPYKLDWRILSSSFNTVYYDPSQNYTPWAGPCLTDGTLCANASFTAARSNPRQGQSGYSATRDLTGFVYEVWTDDRGYSSTRPRRGTNINVTSAPNGIVDLWDKHTQYTVGAASITVVVTTYAPTSTGMHPTTSTSTITDAATVATVKQNIANWYQYYRKRSFVAKGAIASVISENPSYRYGLSVINNSSTLFKEVPPSSATDFSTYNTALLTALFNYVWPSSGTPLRVGLKNVGDYYSGNLSGKTNPITSPCQKCFTILLTDGYWNESFSTIKDIDGDGIQSTLADVARYYYITDLSALADNVPSDSFDTATYQHMVTYAVAFGVKGNLADTDGDGWPNPALAVNGNWGNPTSCTDCAEKIDDMWHAAFNSKGGFIAAKSARALIDSLRNAFQDIANRTSSVAALALNSGSSSSLSKVYQAKFNGSTWQGSLEASTVSNGAVGAVAWEAGTLLPSYSARTIITHNGTGGVPFAWSSLSSSQQAALNTTIAGATDTLGSLRLNYLRGDGTKEVTNSCTDCVFRSRPNSKLGDIVNSAPQYTSGESLRNAASFNGASYSSYVATKAARTPMVYVGANDGMLHGFDANTGVEKLAYVPARVYSNLSKLTSPSYSHRYYVDGTPTIGDAYYNSAWHTVLVGSLAGGGQGVFALDITNPDNFSESNASSLVMWEFSDANDADLGYTFSRPNIVRMANGTWAAVFGNGYNNTEADGSTSSTGAAVLYIVNLQTGALIKKISTGAGASLDPKGTSRPNGFTTVVPVDANQDGVIDYIYGGDLFGNLWKFDVTSASTTSWDVAFYSGTTALPLFHACSGAGTTCTASNAQSITSRMTVGAGPNGSGYMIYFGTGKYLESSDIADTSTQTFYGIWDKNDSTNALCSPLSTWNTCSKRASLLQQTVLYENTATLQGGGTSQTIRVTSDNHYASSPPAQLGWYLDLLPPSGIGVGERFITQPLLRNGRIIFTTNIPSANSCTGGGDSWLMALNASDGSRLAATSFNVNGDTVIDAADTVQYGGAGNYVVVSGMKKAALLTSPVAACTGSTCDLYMSSGNGEKEDDRVSLGLFSIERKSWRQIK